MGGLTADQERTDLWLESVRAYNAQRQRQNRAEWYAFHMDQAERIEKTARELAEEHRQQAEELMTDEPRGETA